VQSSLDGAFPLAALSSLANDQPEICTSKLCLDGGVALVFSCQVVMAQKTRRPGASKVSVLAFLTLHHFMASFVIKEFVHGTMELTLQAHLDADPHGALHPGATLNLDRQLQLIHEDMRCQSLKGMVV